MKRFEKKVVVVTGSATGIGRAAVIRFASEGAAVACLDVADEANRATESAALELGAQAEAMYCDVRSLEDQESAVSTVLRR